MPQTLLFSLLFLLVCFLYGVHAYFKHRRHARAIVIADRTRQANIEVMINQILRARTETNSSFIDSLPAFTYTTSNSNQNVHDLESTGVKPPLLVHECVICLSTVKEGEVVRVLPNCLHMFHVECIDMWLSSHSSCPICRSGAAPATAASASASVVPVAGDV